jgi:alpha-D-xyloside xylohydrolase
MDAFDVVVPNWGRIAPVEVTGPAAKAADGAVGVPTSAGTLSITLHENGARLRLGAAARDYGILASVGPQRAPTVTLRDGQIVISAGDLEVALTAKPLSFELRAGGRLIQSSPTDAHFVRRFRLPPLARLANGWLLSLELGSSTPVYGLGEKSGRLDKRGQLVRSCNHDALGVNAEISYKNAPFAWSPEGWGVFVHTAAAVTHAVGFAPWSQRAYVLKVDDAALDVFLFTGRDGAELIRQYTALTGRAPVPPLWSLGVILSRAYYKDAAEIVAAARDVRARGMPCDTITFDGRAWQDTETRFAFEWCPKRYPDPRPTIAALQALDFRICVWEYPLVSVKNQLFAAMAAKGWLLKDRRTGAAYRYQWDLEPFGPVLSPLPESGLVDFTHPEAYAYWRDRHRELFDVGVDMIKPDFGEQVEPDMVASNGATGDELHNVYALLYNRCVYEAAERYAKGGAFLFSRAGWSGSQRYPSQWGGDPQADWGGLAANLRSGLSWGLSGAPYYATDVGGFYGDQRDPILYVRWAQAAVYSAHMRLHGIGPREPWSYGSQAEACAMEALRLRYRLIPYLWRALERSHATGLPVQRPMALALPEDRAAWAFEDQFFCGDDLLVAPCLRPDGRVQLYLPPGDWNRFPAGEHVRGGRVLELDLALAETAVFAREGARIPLGPVVSHCGELGAEPGTETLWQAG